MRTFIVLILGIVVLAVVVTTTPSRNQTVSNSIRGSVQQYNAFCLDNAVSGCNLIR